MLRQETKPTPVCFKVKMESKNSRFVFSKLETYFSIKITIPPPATMIGKVNLKISMLDQETRPMLFKIKTVSKNSQFVFFNLKTHHLQ